MTWWQLHIACAKFAGQELPSAEQLAELYPAESAPHADAAMRYNDAQQAPAARMTKVNQKYGNMEFEIRYQIYTNACPDYCNTVCLTRLAAIQCAHSFHSPVDHQ